MSKGDPGTTYSKINATVYTVLTQAPTGPHRATGRTRPNSMKRIVACILLLTMLQLTNAHREQRLAERLLPQVLKDLAAIRDNIFTFWACHGMDTTYGGFHGTISRDGAGIAPVAKGLVQQCRHCWAFSTFYQHGYTHASSNTCSGGKPDKRGAASSSSSTLPSSQEMATSAYKFASSYMHRPDGFFNWNVSRDGKTVVQNNTVVYGQWFVLYSFSKYAEVFDDAAAKEYALACFRAIDAAWHNSSTGGYNEFQNNTFPADLGSAATGSDLQALVHDILSKTAEQVFLPRTLNVMMHGIEALTALHTVTKSPTVLDRVKEYLDIICTKLTRANGLIFEEYEAPSGQKELWQPTPGTVVNYGHNLESVWLVAETLDYLESLNAISHTQAARYRSSVMFIGEAAVRVGFDTQHGGVFESGSADSGAESKVKVWWIQAESMLGMWKLYKYYNDVSYLQKLACTAEFVRRFVTDSIHGEQYWQVEADGTFEPTQDLDKGTKGNRWKASYHNTRSVLFLEKWIKESR